MRITGKIIFALFLMYLMHPHLAFPQAELKDNSFYEDNNSFLAIYPDRCISLLNYSDYVAVRVTTYQDSNKINDSLRAIEISETEFNAKLAECLFKISGVEICENPVLTLNSMP